MALLMVRNVDEAVVRELKRRAARRDHSAEQEHREALVTRNVSHYEPTGVAVRNPFT